MNKLNKLLLLLMVCTSSAFSAPDIFDQEEESSFDETLVIKSQDELVGTIPPLSKDELTLLYLDNTPTGFDVYLDKKSISVGKFDGIIRYWVVYQNKSGAFNADYEGLSCTREEYLVYAFANVKGKIHRLKVSEWQDTHRLGGRDHHLEMQRDYLCYGKRARNTEQLEAVLSNRYHDEGTEIDDFINK